MPQRRRKAQQAALWHQLPRNFEAQVKEMLRQGYTRFHFDDGYADITRAADVLESHGHHGVFFIVPGWLGLQGQATIEQVQDLHKRGHEIGNHTMSHVLMHRVPMPVVAAEVERAQLLLASWTGVRPRRFAWPYGLSNKAGRELVALTGEFREVRGITRKEVTPL